MGTGLKNEGSPISPEQLEAVIDESGIGHYGKELEKLGISHKSGAAGSCRC